MNEMTVAEFLKDMAKHGFDGDFKAYNADQTYIGQIDTDGKITSRKVTSADEARQKIKDMLK
jgi:hypothetical protein